MSSDSTPTPDPSAPAGPPLRIDGMEVEDTKEIDGATVTTRIKIGVIEYEGDDPLDATKLLGSFLGGMMNAVACQSENGPSSPAEAGD